MALTLIDINGEEFNVGIKSLTSAEAVGHTVHIRFDSGRVRSVHIEKWNDFIKKYGSEIRQENPHFEF